MPDEDCTLTQALIMGPGISLSKMEWIACLQVLGTVFIAAVIGVPAIPLRALWECTYRTSILQVSSRSRSHLPPDRGVRL
jgi:hypothetical protein